MSIEKVSEPRVLSVWTLGFDTRPNFFYLHCPMASTRRFRLCTHAMGLLSLAFPHLIITQQTMTEDQYEELHR